MKEPWETYDTAAQVGTLIVALSPLGWLLLVLIHWFTM